MAIGSGALLPGVAENPTFPILCALAYTTGLGYRPTCDCTWTHFSQMKVSNLHNRLARNRRQISEVAFLHVWLKASVSASGIRLQFWRTTSGANVPTWRNTSTSRHWSQTTTMFYLINVSGCSTYSSVHCQWQSVSCHSHSSVEQSSITRHCCPLSLHLLLSP